MNLSNRKHRLDIISKQPILYIAGFIMASYIFFLFVGPFVLIVSYSFHDRDFFGGVADTWSVEGWRALLSFPVLIVFGRSILMAGVNTLTCLAVGIPLSMSIYNSSPKAKKAWIAILILPMAVNTLLISYSWQALLSNSGIINSALISMGVIKEPLNMMFTRGAVLLGLFASYLPFFTIAFLTSLERLDDGYIVASRSLGARDSQTIWKIIFPMTKPGLVTGSLLVFLPSFAEYVIPDLLGGGKVFFIGNLSQFAFYEGRNWPMGAAVMVTTIFTLVSFTVPIMHYIRGVFEE